MYNAIFAKYAPKRYCIYALSIYNYELKNATAGSYVEKKI